MGKWDFNPLTWEDLGFTVLPRERTIDPGWFSPSGDPTGRGREDPNDEAARLFREDLDWQIAQDMNDRRSIRAPERFAGGDSYAAPFEANAERNAAMAAVNEAMGRPEIATAQRDSATYETYDAQAWRDLDRVFAESDAQREQEASL